ncbi:hypothetical protein Hanom_Chr14g01324631 [Helianthus anomalus]
MNGGDGGDVAAAPDGPPPPLDWKLSQVFGERPPVKKCRKIVILVIMIFLLWVMHLGILDLYFVRFVFCYVDFHLQEFRGCLDVVYVGMMMMIWVRFCV